MNNETNSQDTMFADDWQAWIVVRHFLPARLLRALVQEVVRQAANETVSVTDLFEELYVDDPIGCDSWLIRPREGVTEYASSLQMWTRGVVWQNDRCNLGLAASAEDDGDFVSRTFLQVITHLGSVELGSPEDPTVGLLDPFLDQQQPSLGAYIAAFRLARQACEATASDDLWADIGTLAESVSMPLKALMLKQVADLFAERDAWQHASTGYAMVASQLRSWAPPEHLRDAVQAWREIVTQSRSFAARVLEGKTQASEILEDELGAATLTGNPILTTNGGLDALNVRVHLDGEGFRDGRVARISAPLLQLAQDPGPAVRYWLQGKHRDANGRFWSLLRRQIALGAATDVRTTKAWYARCLLEELASQLRTQHDAASFQMAIRLLVETEDSASVERAGWSEALIDAYLVDEKTVAAVALQAKAYKGALIGRTKVLVALFESWAQKLTPSRDALTVVMWTHIISAASDFEATFRSDTDVGRPALKALQSLAKKRPELCHQVAADVAQAICKKLGESSAWGQVEAVETAIVYVKAFLPVSQLDVTRAILEALEQEAPDRDFWPLSEPALRFLVAPHVRASLQNESELNQRCLDQVFRFGLSEGTGNMALFFNLAAFDVALLRDDDVRSRVAGPLRHVRRQAVQVSSSNVTENIRALLIAPQLVGYDGISDALKGLSLILEAAGAGRSTLGLPSVDGPLLLLVERLDTIRAALEGKAAWFDNKLAAIGAQLADVWVAAAGNPLLFATFALPERTKPDDVVVHNCAFASLRFAHAVGQKAQVNQALEDAGKNAALGGAIAFARATHASGLAFVREDLTPPLNQNRDSFYQSIGRRLAQMQHLPEKEARRLCRRLVEQSFLLGPRAPDAALLLAAAHLKIHDDVRACGLPVYAARVRADPKMRTLLVPLLDLFQTEDD